MDCLGEAACFPGAAAELVKDVPGLELGVCPFVRGAEFRVGPVGLFLWLGLVLPRVWHLRPLAALVALMGERDQALLLQFVEDSPDPLGLLSWTDPGRVPGTHRMSPCGEAMTCRFIPCFSCLPE